MQLQMRSQLALIGLEISKPFLHLRTTRPKVELQIKKPEIKIHSPRPVLHIDQTQCFMFSNAAVHISSVTSPVFAASIAALLAL